MCFLSIKQKDKKEKEKDKNKKKKKRIFYKLLLDSFSDVPLENSCWIVSAMSPRKFLSDAP